eukprot:3431667-Rhodomonas_salina.1
MQHTFPFICVLHLQTSSRMLNGWWRTAINQPEKNEDIAQKHVPEQAKHVQVLKKGDKVWYRKNGIGLEADIVKVDSEEADNPSFTVTPTQINAADNARTIETEENSLKKFSIQWPVPKDSTTKRQTGQFVGGSLA